MSEPRFQLRLTLIAFGLLVSTALLPSTLSAASSIESASCGQFLERAFDEPDQIHDYKIWMEPGETMTIRAVPIGDTLSLRVAVYEPANQVVGESDYLHEVRLSAGKLSARGIHTVRVRNSQYRDGSGDSRVGTYTLELSCVRSDGVRVEAGDQGRGPVPGLGSGAAVSPLQAGQPGPGALAGAQAGLSALGKYADDVQKLQGITSTVSGALGGVVGAVEIARDIWTHFRKGTKRGADGTGAPQEPVYQRPEELAARGGQPAYASPVESLGVQSPRPPAPTPAQPSSTGAAVDRRTFPLLGLGTLLQGEVTLSSGAQGCRFQAQTGQKIDIAFERLTGDLGLVVTVFGPDQRLVFQTSVLANPRVATTLQVPVSGEYAVEIARAGSPGTATRFTVQVTATAE